MTTRKRPRPIWACSYTKKPVRIRLVRYCWALRGRGLNQRHRDYRVCLLTRNRPDDSRKVVRVYGKVAHRRGNPSGRLVSEIVPQIVP
jgi:hypothetical protein